MSQYDLLISCLRTSAEENSATSCLIAKQLAELYVQLADALEQERSIPELPALQWGGCEDHFANTDQDEIDQEEIMLYRRHAWLIRLTGELYDSENPAPVSDALSKLHKELEAKFLYTKSLCNFCRSSAIGAGYVK